MNNNSFAKIRVSELAVYINHFCNTARPFTVFKLVHGNVLTLILSRLGPDDWNICVGLDIINEANVEGISLRVQAELNVQMYTSIYEKRIVLTGTLPNKPHTLSVIFCGIVDLVIDDASIVVEIIRQDLTLGECSWFGEPPPDHDGN